ncbi:hypothetical protein [Xanthomonas axonopodis]
MTQSITRACGSRCPDGLGALGGEPQPVLHKGQSVRAEQRRGVDRRLRPAGLQVDHVDAMEGAIAGIGHVGGAPVRRYRDFVRIGPERGAGQQREAVRVAQLQCLLGLGDHQQQPRRQFRRHGQHRQAGQQHGQRPGGDAAPSTPAATHHYAAPLPGPR